MSKMLLCLSSLPVEEKESCVIMMNKYEKIYNLAARKNPNVRWIDSAIIALVVDIEEYTKEPVQISGPFGLRAEVMINVGISYLTIIPSFDSGILKLYYDTGQKIEKFSPLSIGDINGFNNVQAPLPDTLEEIIDIIRGEKKNGYQNT